MYCCTATGRGLGLCDDLLKMTPVLHCVTKTERACNSVKGGMLRGRGGHGLTLVFTLASSQHQQATKKGSGCLQGASQQD